MEDNINTKNKEERDWEKTGIKVLDMAKQELFLGMRYMFLALNMLGYKADRRIRFVATDGRFLYYKKLQKESDRCQQGVFTYDNALSVQAYI